MNNYISLMEKVLEAYITEHIRSYTRRVEENMIQEQFSKPVTKQKKISDLNI